MFKLLLISTPEFLTSKGAYNGRFYTKENIGVIQETAFKLHMKTFLLNPKNKDIEEKEKLEKTLKETTEKHYASFEILDSIPKTERTVVSVLKFHGYPVTDNLKMLLEHQTSDVGYFFVIYKRGVIEEFHLCSKVHNQITIGSTQERAENANESLCSIGCIQDNFDNHQFRNQFSKMLIVNEEGELFT